MRKTAVFRIVFIVTISCMLVFVPSVEAQNIGTWISKPSMLTARLDPAVVTLDNKIYAIGGRSGLQLKDLSANEQYDPKTGTWITMADMPTPKANFAAVAYHGKICVFSGGLIQVYDPKTNRWNQASIPSDKQVGNTAVEVNGKIYLIGSGQRQDVVTVYDPTKDSWTTKRSFPESAIDQIAVALDSKIFVIANIQPKVTTSSQRPIFQSRTLIYDTLTDTWSYGVPIPLQVSYATAIAANASGLPAIYVIGGSPQNTPSQNGIPYPASTYVQTYFPKGNYWSSEPMMLTDRAHAGATVVNNQIYVIGGSHSTTYIQAMQPDLLGIKIIDQATGRAQGIWGPPVLTTCLVAVEEATNQAYTFQKLQTPVPPLMPSTSPSSTPSPSPSPSFPPTQQPTLEPTETATPTSDDNQTLDVTTSMILSLIAVIALAVGLLVFIRRR